jgi:K+/H+ antiporter YhaU regulatory subunit KhtT
MEPTVRKAMDGLLSFRKKDRWTMDTLTECEWVKAPQGVQTLNMEISVSWHKPSGTMDHNRKLLRLFQSSQPMPTALAVNISAKNHKHLINKSLGELELGKKLGVTVLLVRKDNGTIERVPGVQTQIQRGDWIYFGVPQGEEFTKAVDGLETLLCGSTQQQSPTSPTDSSSICNFRSLSKRDVIAGKLLEFTVEFDCFFFPEHIGQHVEVGLNGLNLRSRFGINLVGIERDGQEGDDLEWFPHGEATVQPGDIGLVMREPCADGSTRPTLTDEDLASLMSAELFLSAVTPK